MSDTTDIAHPLGLNRYISLLNAELLSYENKARVACLNRYISLLNAELLRAMSASVLVRLNRYISLLNAEHDAYIEKPKLKQVLIDTYRCLMQNLFTCWAIGSHGTS